MSGKVVIKDGTGGGYKACVDNNNSILVTNTGVPPENVNVVLRPFVEFMTDLNGSSDMLVDGSTDNIEFFIQAGGQGDRFIHTLAITISDAVPKFNKWGALTALTNGCQLVYEDPKLGDVVLGENLRSNFDWVQFCNFEPMFGTGNDAFLAMNIEGTSEGYIPILDIEDVFGISHGIRLPANSTKKLKLIVRDDVSGIDRFDIKVFGYDRINLNEI